MTSSDESKVAALALSLGISLKPEDPSLTGLLHVFDVLRDQGLVLMVKWDGERQHSQYTALISGPPLDGEDTFFRTDKSSIEAAMQDVLARYYDWVQARSE